MHWQIARSGHGPLSFWRTIGVVRPRKWIVLVLWMQSLTESGGGWSSWRSSSLSCCWSVGEDDDAISMVPDLLRIHTTPQLLYEKQICQWSSTTKASFIDCSTLLSNPPHYFAFYFFPFPNLFLSSFPLTNFLSKLIFIIY